MTPLLNRWTGQPHRHERERARRLRQLRAQLLKELALAEMARQSAGLYFEDFDSEDMARKLETVRLRLVSPSA